MRHSEDEPRTMADIIGEWLFMNVADPRPIKVGRGPDTFLRYLEIGGFLPDNLTQQERQHLLHKVQNMVRSAVYQDRKDKLMP